MIAYACYQLCAIAGTPREIALILGLMTFVGGLLAMFSHQRAYKETFQTPLKRAEIVFESRKYRRRIVVASLISSLGVMLACLKWIVEPRQYASLILIILLTLLAIFVIALIDMYSVGLQAMTRKKEINRQQLLEQYLERKKAEHAARGTDHETAE